MDQPSLPITWSLEWSAEPYWASYGGSRSIYRQGHTAPEFPDLISRIKKSEQVYISPSSRPLTVSLLPQVVICLRNGTLSSMIPPTQYELDIISSGS